MTNSIKVSSRLVVIAVLCFGLTRSANAVENSPLQTKFAKFDTYNLELGTMQVVNELVNRFGIACLFVGTSHDDGAHSDDSLRYSLERFEVTPYELLDEIVKIDQKYVWVPIGEKLVNVLPADVISDLGSALNAAVSDVLISDAPLGEAIAVVQAHDPGERKVFTGFATDNRGGPTNATIRDRRVTLHFESGTYLDLINALIVAAGPDLGWFVHGSGQLVVLKTFQARVKTVALAKAEDYVSGGQPNWQNALALYNAALDDAPYEALKKAISLKIADAYMGNTGQSEHLFPDVQPNHEIALPIFLDLAVPREANDWDASVYNQSRDSAVGILLKQGKTTDARALLQEILNLENSASLVVQEHIYDSLVGIDILGRSREEALEVLKSMRQAQPENVPYHNALETRIERLEKELALIQRYDNGDETVLDNLIAE